MSEELTRNEAQKFLIDNECADLVISKHCRIKDFKYVSDIMQEFANTRTQPVDSGKVEAVINLVDKMLFQELVKYTHINENDETVFDDSTGDATPISLFRKNFLTKIRNTLEGNNG